MQTPPSNILIHPAMFTTAAGFWRLNSLLADIDHDLRVVGRRAYMVPHSDNPPVDALGFVPHPDGAA